MLVLLLTPLTFAYAPKVGKAAAARYFQNERKHDGRVSSAEEESGYDYGAESSSNNSSQSPKPRPARHVANENAGDHYMSLGFGTFSEGTAYNWGQNGREEDIGKWGADLTYRMSEQEYLFDQSLKLSYAQYKPALQDSSKLSFMYAITFPEAGSQFPIYFGAAVGLGVYLKQVSDESMITADYQLFIGARIFNLFDSVGLYVEGGMRNHLHITSDGQFNGTFLSAGMVFTF